MKEHELNRRLAAMDPARPAPTSLDTVVDELVRRPHAAPHRRRWRVAALAGGVLVVGGGLAAFTDLDTFMLSIPPFSALDEGTIRTTDGLPYVPVGEHDRGEQCAIWVDFGGLTSEQVASVNDYWSNADPEAFAEGVAERLDAVPTTDEEEGNAKIDQLLEDFGRIVPGLAWGSAAPGHPWEPGQPHLTTVTTGCSDEMKPTT